jgi:iron(III) transport system ATP-binding protein
MGDVTMSDGGESGGTEGEVYLRVSRLTKKFGSFTALDNVTLDIFEGEFVCFLGPSGCGKTTLLRAIAGLDIQTHGQVEQAGHDISALPPAERDFGIVFQSYALFPNLTVIKNIAYGLENQKASKADITARVTELLDLVGLPDQGPKDPSQLSGGQQQRIIATSPGLLLLDEPLSALDAKVRGYLRHEIKELQRKLGVTTIMVTHDQEEALTMADRIVVMSHGVIEQIGSPTEIYRDPATAFVADFIGKMNFLPGEASGPGQVRLGGTELVCGHEGLALGSKITVAIRPEDIVLQGVSEGNENAFSVTVAEAEFLGSFVRASLAGGGLGEHRLQADFSMNLVRRLGINQGDEIMIALPPAQLRIYPGDAGNG